MNSRIPTKLEQKYIAWQNRAFYFYLSSRILRFNDLELPSVYSAHQSIEILLKATLTYWDKSFKPKKYSHNFPKLISSLSNKVPKAENIRIPHYFYEDQTFFSNSRYILEGQPNVILIPGELIPDLDKCFYDLITLVPIQFNSQLVKTISYKKEKTYDSLIQENHKFDDFLTYLDPWLVKGSGLAPFPDLD